MVVAEAAGAVEDVGATLKNNGKKNPRQKKR
jgi:hypothetical protein